MADQLYLSLWFPNFRLESLPSALVGVLRQFATISGDQCVRAASAYPIDFTESPTYQRIFVIDDRAAETPDTAAAHIENAVAEATEQLHEDMAYEFEMAWNLWLPDPSRASNSTARHVAANEHPEEQEESDTLEDSFADLSPRAANAPIPFPSPAPVDAQWKQRPATVRILGFGPQFDTAGFTQNGHVRVDFGLDTPWTMESPIDLHPDTSNRTGSASMITRHIQQNVEMLLAFTLLVEKHGHLSSRLLWTESGEPLAEKLVASLQRLH